MNNKTNKAIKELGQYYTRSFLVDFCLLELQNKIDLTNFDLAIEPSAGTGEFSNKLKDMFKKTLFYDLEPKGNNIIKQDFLNLELKTKSQKTIIIGNPPFGKNSSLAIKFFNKSCELADCIAFIVPKTFKKESTHNKLNLNFACHYSIDLPKNGFYTELAEQYNVPCCFQIWVKTPVKRAKKQYIPNKYIELTSFKDKDICIRRAGSKAGQIIECKKEVDGIYFIKVKDNKVINLINSKEFNEISSEFINNTAGNRSISWNELIYCIYLTELITN